MPSHTPKNASNLEVSQSKMSTVPDNQGTNYETLGYEYQLDKASAETILFFSEIFAEDLLTKIDLDFFVSVTNTGVFDL